MLSLWLACGRLLRIRRETWDKPAHTVSIVLKKKPGQHRARAEMTGNGPKARQIGLAHLYLIFGPNKPSSSSSPAWPLQLRRRPAPPLPLAPLSSTDHQRRPVPARVLASPNPPPQWRASPEVLKRSSHLCRPC
jgi:hypothetical protein